MSYFKSLALISGALLPLSVSAFAADAIRGEPYVPAPVVHIAAQDAWAGGYTGLYLGGAKNIFKNGSHDSSLKTNSAKFGGYAGWNFQDDNIVYGIEGDAGYNKAKKTKNGLSTQSGFDGSLRARLGYDMGPVMPYVTAGVAGTQMRYSDAVDADKKFRLGWTAGAGAETFLTKNITARIEYRYSDFGKKNISLSSLAVPGSKLKSHDIRIGIGYKF